MRWRSCISWYLVSVDVNALV